MNCHHARKLISPYLDGQLAGREMLALGDHLAGCESCGSEMHSLRQIKALLRGMHAPRPRTEFSRRLSSQEILSQTAAPPVLTWRFAAAPPRPQRGRRLLAALALSCLTVSSLTTLAFAPASRGGRAAPAAVQASAFWSAPGLTPDDLAQPAAAFDPLFSPAAAPRRGFPALSGADDGGRVFYAQSYGVPAYGQAPAPFQAGTVSLSAYRPR